MPKVDENTTLLVLSDHGFAPYRHSFNLNTWLLNNGYITRKEGVTADGSEPFFDVDWSRTRAYGLGLNGLYLNIRGREHEGIVDPARRPMRCWPNSGRNCSTFAIPKIIRR